MNGRPCACDGDCKHKRDRAWRAANPGYMTKAHRGWRARNPERARAHYAAKAAARRAQAEPLDMPPAAAYGCSYCPAQADTWDHYIPLARGGCHAAANLVPACRSCNSSKRDLLPVFEWVTRDDCISRA